MLKSVKITLPGDDTGPAEITADYTVTLPLRETLQTFLNRPALINLANSTGGTYFEVNDTAALLEAVPDRTRKLERWNESARAGVRPALRRAAPPVRRRIRAR